ncbi:glycosyltransferase family 4 protein [Pontiellaceae bacterium B12227]|nr:glycosyltransferase family 4 protein [Pontiellaceae bacterium B12227]
MKIAVMGSFPIYPFKDRIKFWNNRPNLTTTWNYNLAYALARIPGLEVHFLTMAPLWKTKVLTDENLTIHFIGHLPKLDKLDKLTNMRYSCSILRRYLKQLKPDLVHGSGTDHEYGYVAATCQLPNVITVHGVMKMIGQNAPPPPKSVVWQYIRHEPMAINAASHLISINPYVDQQFPEFSGEVYSIPNPVGPEFFQEVKPGERNKYQIVFVGKIYPLKRVLNLLKALTRIKGRFPEVSLKVVGGVSDVGYQDTLERYVIEHDLRDNIEFCGSQPQDKVMRIMQESSCLVLPSIQETAPMVIAEAFAMGSPVIASDVGGVKYMVDDGENGFVIPPDNIDALAEKLSSILKDSSLRNSMSEAARQSAKLYHPEEVARKTADVYEMILNGGRS